MASDLCAQDAYLLSIIEELEKHGLDFDEVREALDWWEAGNGP